ncbi:MAG: 50S ribosomal protein L18 [Spirochaetes bacterium]|nr:50S ribosomal protein L18 [Spirochaetota bacterium]
MKKLIAKRKRRIKRKLRIRGRISGTADRPRMTVFKSNKYTYIQVIDDVSEKTIVSASNLEKELKSVKNRVKDVEKLGETLAKRLLEKKINTVVFDRNGYLYHGIVKSIADGARKAGLKF